MSAATEPESTRSTKPRSKNSLLRTHDVFLVIAVVVGWFLGSAYASAPDRTVRKFHELYWASQVPQSRTFWLGVQTQQTPTDMWAIQQILYDVRPEYLIETGTLRGGSALFHATVLRELDPHSRIITIDIEPQVAQASRFSAFREMVEVWTASSISPETLARLNDRVRGHRTVVLLDSNHSQEHVSQELRLYAPLVSPGSYMIVHDTNFRGDGPPPVQGPLAAVRRFVAANPQFQIDQSREAMMLTLSSSGYLKRVRE